MNSFYFASTLLTYVAGVVTKMIMRAIPNKVWAEARVYATPQNAQLMEALMEYHKIIETDNKATLVWHTLNHATLLVFFYCAPVENPDAFKPFYDIPFLQTVIPGGCRTVYGMVQATANILAAEQQWFVLYNLTHGGVMLTNKVMT